VLSQRTSVHRIGAVIITGAGPAETRVASGRMESAI
jgi:hypothetical protein